MSVILGKKKILSPQAASNTKNLDVGANVFIGNLDVEIDEKLLYDIFSAFGVILQTPKVCQCLCLFPYFYWKLFCNML